MSDGPTFHNEQSGDNAVNKQAMTIVEGDNADSIDKSQNSTVNVDGDVHGDVNANNVQADTATFQKAIKDLFDEMVKTADEMGVEPYVAPIEPPATTSNDEPVVFEDFDSLEAEDVTDGSDHPAAVYGMVQNMQESDVTPTEDEQKSLWNRMTSSVKKYATKENGVKAMKIAVAGISAASSLAPPLGIIKSVLETTAALNE